MTKPSLPDLLHAAVSAVGGTERPGQVAMAEAVADAVDDQAHLLVQAGTGTGKSLGYLVPALAHGERVVVATATLALQRQLVERDLPRTVEALHPQLRRRPQFAMLKGRSNYLCLHRLHEGVPQEEEDGLFDVFEQATPTSKLGKDLLRLRDWADETETGDRDDLTPGVSDRAWGQVSVASRECLGASKCAYGAECFAEAARERAKLADVVITNHALLAIDAIEGAPILPQHEVLIIDEAHELVSRVTGVATGELTPGQVGRAVRRAAKLVNEKVADQLQTASDTFERLMELALPGRLEEVPEDLGYCLMALRDAARTVIVALGSTRDKSVQDEDAVRKQALAAVENVHDVAERIVNGSEYDVVWYERHDRFGASLRVAPLSVSGLLREKLFTDRSVVLTSATLKLGGDFNGVAASLGLGPEGTAREDEPVWKGLDVGSPFDYGKQGILYVAKHLAQPGREGSRDDMLDELAELIEAAGGRTLGLFSSMRGAQAAAEAMRGRLDVPVLLQGEETLGELIRTFAADARTCLFGTLSLWQGVDVPGPNCQLVVMDRVPFPRPDDPLMSARQKSVEEAGGNGFMAVAATHAALLMAQGAGRLVRATGDRGVVAVLDPRVERARYGSFLRKSMPDFWYTTDRNLVRGSLARIDQAAKAAVGEDAAGEDAAGEDAAGE
ncbi:ATP-dependent helicase [Streptomyces noursei ZPM]|uniref:ATP-dependent helicase DinG n=3 Tax=Streptomyces TaxID=1883 RepID=A0A401R8T4_STRNR|nr:ATP-dependent DNA helicase [Streptomyces noursei]AKA03153.1 ATP-dependent helicase [Streptomyces noursei ZPM]EOT03967.2 ATP-dependent helicase [Streptomyces noursei CCRC 11814]EXU88092.1 ATP-dependent helicase [Streptomyces noursei PD-1]UWS74799.1 ATP-dependent DNA helicase [Streptomyces noursei]GCB94010.1 ATP-dependent helicase [Streptomyces noursei]